MSVASAAASAIDETGIGRGMFENAFGAADENSLSISILQAFFPVSLNKRGYCYKEHACHFADVEQVRSLFTNALNFGASYSHAITMTMMTMIMAAAESNS